MTTQLRTRQLADANVTLAKLASDVRLDTITAPTGSVGLNSQKITSLADPVSAQDAATKTYTDTAISTAVAAAVSGSDWKASVRLATTANVPLLSAVVVADIDGSGQGITLVAGDRVLLAAQTTGSENGIYVVGTVSVGLAPVTRSTDADVSAEVTNGMATTVEEGSKANYLARLTTANPITLGTTALVFSIDPVSVIAGAGLTLTGATLAVNVDDSSIEINSDTLRVKASGITNTMLAGSIADSKLSTITTGNKVSGSAVQITATGGLEDSTGLKIKPDVTTGATVLPIAIAANGAGVTLDNSTLENNAGTGRVKASGITANELASNAVTTVKITDANVTLAKIANAAANSKLLGSGASGSGAAYSEITLGTGLSMSGTTLNASATTSFATDEAPSGSINGSNVTFVLANTPTSGSVALYLNGQKITVANGDYTISSATITMATAPLTGESLVADYRY